MSRHLRQGACWVPLLLCLSLPALAQPTWRVKDSFDAGPAVYVRALSVEPARGALWVGTSAGVHEVDLTSGKLRNTFTRKEGLANADSPTNLMWRLQNDFSKAAQAVAARDEAEGATFTEISLDIKH